MTNHALAQHKLTIEFENMGPHLGQDIYIRVVDQASEVEVGRKILHSISEANFSTDLYVLLEGHDYTIDMFADHNYNGMYDAPPVDHTWRLQYLNAEENATIVFVHNANFTDINWPSEFNVEDYVGAWEGRWDNLRYGSFDDVVALAEVFPDSNKVKITSTTSLIFGNPAVETKVGNGYYTLDEDSVFVNAPEDWTGTATVTHGEITGSGWAPDFGGIDMEIKGNFGPSQVIVVFEMSGAVVANGVIVMHKQGTSINPQVPQTQALAFELLQNYPNPFNPTTVIPFTLSNPEVVTAKVFNTTGQEVVTLLTNQQMPAGQHELAFNAVDLPTGLYYYRVQAGSFSAIRRMMLVK